MSEKSIDLKKIVISNRRAQELHDGAFNEIILSPEKIDDKKLKKIYEDLFYQIPKMGKASHEEIIIKSNNVVNPEININYDNKIKELEQTILEKNEKLLKEELPPEEHPIFSNNTFIQEGDISTNISMGGMIWFVQEGYKRQIIATPKEFYFNLLRKVNNDPIVNNSNQNISIQNSPLFQLATADEINAIPEAQDINNGTSLSISPLIAKEIQEYIYSQLRISFKCDGVEKYYKFSEEEKIIFPNDEGYWYIDTDAGCEVTYQTDIDPSTTFEPQTNTINFTGDKRKYISRDLSLYTGDPLDSYFYQSPLNTFNETRNPDSFSTYYPTVTMVKEWGQGTKFPAVVNIPTGHRVRAKIIAPMNPDGSHIFANPTTGASRNILLNGVDTNSLGQENIFKFFNKKSNNGFTMINNFCYGPLECFGKLNQIPLDVFAEQNNTETEGYNIMKRLLNIFNDKNSNYYKGSKRSKQYGSFISGRWRVEGGVYGQPILYVKKKLSVFLGSRRQLLTDWNVFYDLESGDFHKISNASLNNKVEGYKKDSGRFFDWLRKGDNNRINNPTLYYPGLKGVPINYTNTDLDSQVTTFQSLYGNENDNEFNENDVSDFGELIFEGNQVNDNPFNLSNIGSNSQLNDFNGTLKYFNPDTTTTISDIDLTNTEAYDDFINNNDSYIN